MAARIANIGFLLIFPGFFFWNLARATQLIPTHSGLFGEVTAIISLLFSTLFLSKWVNLALRDVFAAFVLLFLVYCTVWTLFMGLQMDRSDLTVAAMHESLVTVVSLFALLSIGAYLDIESGRFRFAVWISLAAMGFLVVYYLDRKWLIFDPRWYFQTDNTASYQGFSRSVTLTSLLALSLVNRLRVRVFFIAACLPIIFLAAARAELFGFMFCVLMVELLLTLRRGTNFLVWIFVGTCAAIILIENLGALGTSRQFEVFDLSKSSSWIARQEMNEIAWRQIIQNPLLGLFGGDRWMVEGGYAHNALSAWVTYGFLGFALYCGLAAAAFLKALRWFLNRDEPMSRLAVYLNTFSLLLITVASPVFWPVIALGWGVLLNRKAAIANLGSPQIRVGYV